jgi:hypothetical protein
MDSAVHPVVETRAAVMPVDRLVGLCDSVIGHICGASAALSELAAAPQDTARLYRVGYAMDAALRQLQACTELLRQVESGAAAVPRSGSEPARPATTARSLSLVSDVWRC